VRRRVPAGLLASAGAAMAALLAGCSSSAASTHQTSTPRSGAPQATASTNSPGTVAGGTVPTGPIATAAPGSLAGIAVAVLSLARTSGDTVTAQIKVTNNRTASFDIGSSFIDPAIANPNTTNDAAGITLTDTPNAKKYLVLLDSNQDCICSKQLINADLDAGTSGVIFAEFPAPPTSTRSMQVSVPHFPPIENVAISDASPATPSRGPDGAAGTAAPADEAGLVLTLSRRVVDLNGTKEAGRTTTAGNKVDISLASDVLFAFGKAQLSPGAQQTLKLAADQLSKAPGGTVRVDGYTDDKGNDAVNLPLSDQRAQAVANALTPLVGAGLRFQAAGHGSANPVAPNSHADGSDNPDGRALNRRVSLSFQR